LKGRGKVVKVVKVEKLLAGQPNLKDTLPLGETLQPFNRSC